MQRRNFNASLSLIGDRAPIRHMGSAGGRGMRERILIANDGPVERRLDQTVRGFGYEPAVALLDESGHVRALADIEAEAIRFAISHYLGQMSEVARRLHIGRSTLYRKLVSLGLDAEISDAKSSCVVIR